MKQKLSRLSKYTVNCILIVGIAFTLSILINSVTAAVVEWNEPTCTDPEICNVSTLIDTSDLMQVKTGQLNLVGVDPEPDLEHTNRLSVYADLATTDTAIYAEQNNASGYAIYASGNIEASGTICDSVGCITAGGGGVSACSDCDSRFVKKLDSGDISIESTSGDVDIEASETIYINSGDYATIRGDGTLYLSGDPVKIYSSDWICLQENGKNPVFVGKQAVGVSALFNITSDSYGGAAALGIHTKNGGTNSFVVMQSGDVGIGTQDTNVELDVIGSIEYTGTITDVSDERLKENIEPIENALEKIQTINGVSFNMIDIPEQKELGVIAQDVQKVFPEAVSFIDNEQEYLGVSYPMLIPALIEAIKEQQKQIEELQSLIRTK